METVTVNDLTADRPAFAVLGLWDIYFQEQPTTFLQYTPAYRQQRLNIKL